jgi:hypothetical protein
MKGKEGNEREGEREELQGKKELPSFPSLPEW